MPRKFHEDAPGRAGNQDARNVPWLQKGVNSKGFKGMLFNRQERRLRHFYDSLDQYLAAED
ncbi:MAG: hypothetical protein EON58_21935 [Alphaproteobacteria bacterium]|nr:MAG: hypothetical protein EON58_21935 [Alphaproteobacteria bacterium]